MLQHYQIGIQTLFGIVVWELWFAVKCLTILAIVVGGDVTYIKVFVNIVFVAMVGKLK